MKVKASVSKVIQLRYEYGCRDGSVYLSTKRYVRPATACKDWAFYLAGRWVDKKFSINGAAAYHNMTEKDHAWQKEIEKKAYRRALPIFKRMLA